MQKQVRSFPALIKSLDNSQGIVAAFVAIAGNLDYGDDIIAFGAFAKTIVERGHKIKVLDNHNSHSTTNAVAKILRIQEVPKQNLPLELLTEYPDATGGLFVESQYMLDEPTDPSAQIFRRIASGIITEYSIGFEIVKSAYQEIQTNEGVKNVRFIKEIKLWEVSPVIFAMNAATQTVVVKNDEPITDEPIIDQPIIVKNMPNNYRMANDSAMCLSCRNFHGVTKNLGYCKVNDTTVTANYVSDDYLQKNQTVDEILRAQFQEWLIMRIDEFFAMNAWDEKDVADFSELTDTIVSMFIDLIPSSYLNREIPIIESPKSLSIDVQTRAEPTHALLTQKMDVERIKGDINRKLIQARINERKSHAN